MCKLKKTIIIKPIIKAHHKNISIKLFLVKKKEKVKKKNIKILVSRLKDFNSS